MLYKKTVQNRVSISEKYLNFLATSFKHVFVMILSRLKRNMGGGEFDIFATRCVCVCVSVGGGGSKRLFCRLGGGGLKVYLLD